MIESRELQVALQRGMIEESDYAEPDQQLFIRAINRSR
jgi:hypothetical protein